MTQEGAHFFAIKIGAGASTPFDGVMMRHIKMRLTEVSARNQGRLPIVAISALSGVTDKLFRAYYAACETDFTGAEDMLSLVMKDHRRVVLGLKSSLMIDSSVSAKPQKILADMHKQALKTLTSIDGVRDQASLSRLHAKMLSYGEVMASVIFDYAFTACGYGVARIPAINFVRAANNHPDPPSSIDVSINWQTSASLLTCGLGSFQTAAGQGKPNDNHVVLTEGFIGSDEQGEVVTLPREGSDLTTVFIASVVGSRAYLLKNVNPDTGLPKRMSHAELAAHQSRLGTHFVCTHAIQAAIDHDVTIEIVDMKTGETYVSEKRP